MRDAFEIHQCQRWVGWGLQKKGSGIGLDRFLPLIEILAINQCEGNTKPRT